VSDIAIRVAGLGKQYRLGAARKGYVTLREQIRDWSSPRNWFKPRTTPENLFWALKDLSFEVKRGDIVGIIGRNGAGKSTLLKILSRITEPTSGEADLHGRVGSLLEVGTGFHPELSGRENIFLNGAILGMKQSEISRKFKEIVAFAEVDKFIDTPVKHYSSGMYTRLAFAVAAHLEPEILIVDEVLAVGDAAFQKKCLGKMGEVASQGRTVLFVSHNMGAVQSLCKSAIYLEAGKLCKLGSTFDVIREYLQKASVRGQKSAGPVPLGPELELLEIGFRPAVFASGTDATARIRLRAMVDVLLDGLCVLIYSSMDTRVAVIDLRMETWPLQIGEGQELVAEADVENLNLVEAEYKLGLYVQSTNTLADFYDLGVFEVTPGVQRTPVLPYPAGYRGFVDLQVMQPRSSLS
jgi:lipopolysaccharide transport system ATP-binding protein